MPHVDESHRHAGVEAEDSDARKRRGSAAHEAQEVRERRYGDRDGGIRVAPTEEMP